MPKKTSTGRQTAGLSADNGVDAFRRAHDDPVTRAARGSLVEEAATAAGVGTLASHAAKEITAATIGSVVNPGYNPVASSVHAMSAGLAKNIGADFGTRDYFSDHIGETAKLNALTLQAMASDRAIGDQFDLITGKSRDRGIGEPIYNDLVRPRPLAMSGYDLPMRALLDQIGEPRLADTTPRLQRPSRPAPVEAAPLPSFALAKGAPITSVADIGKRVREARKAMGMTQQHFADLAGVGRRFLIELEQGKRSLEIDRVLRVCHAAGIKLGFLA